MKNAPANRGLPILDTADDPCLDEDVVVLAFQTSSHLFRDAVTTESWVVIGFSVIQKVIGGFSVAALLRAIRHIFMTSRTSSNLLSCQNFFRVIFPFLAKRHASGISNTRLRLRIPLTYPDTVNFSRSYLPWRGPFCWRILNCPNHGYTARTGSLVISPVR